MGVRRRPKEGSPAKKDPALQRKGLVSVTAKHTYERKAVPIKFIGKRIT